MPCGGMRSSLMGLWVLGEQLAEVDEPKPAPLGSQTQCPVCGWQINGDFSWCPRCGSRIKPFPCEYCQGLVPMNAQECPHCGALIK